MEQELILDSENLNFPKIKLLNTAIFLSSEGECNLKRMRTSTFKFSNF